MSPTVPDFGGNINKKIGRIGKIYTIPYCFIGNCASNPPSSLAHTRYAHAAALSKMKSPSLINIARGCLVDEKALFDALDSGRITGAGVGVLSEEPTKTRTYSFERQDHDNHSAIGLVHLTGPPKTR
ncbi:MAG: NAD(P)-dependent oxidoreductase [Planctomycetota bacterium]|jgi:hypothetical protein